jgi:hypothetical protein
MHLRRMLPQARIDENAIRGSLQIQDVAAKAGRRGQLREGFTNGRRRVAVEDAIKGLCGDRFHFIANDDGFNLPNVKRMGVHGHNF